MSLPSASGISLRRNIPLSPYTTMRVGGPASYFAEPATESELKEALAFSRRDGLPWVLIGKGSNMIFSDEGYAGLVISLACFEQDRLAFDGSRVRASSGLGLHRLALAVCAQGLEGLEFLAGIPGTVGGALRMNAGFSRRRGAASDISAITESVTVLSPAGGREVWDRSRLKFSYRDSNLRDRIVIEAEFLLRPGDPTAIEREMRANFDYRNRKQDLRYPSAGSIFKNPSPELSAGRLIEEQGLKGTREGGIMVSPKHGNYFINVEGGSGRDVRRLIEKVQARVYQGAGIRLEPEVRIIEKE